jgi:hypothetical protein
MSAMLILSWLSCLLLGAVLERTVEILWWPTWRAPKVPRVDVVSEALLRKRTKQWKAERR